ncbi:hypothetical protein FJTKL_05403 [Diaporthe vaccinii]|uniref:Uncharacterized protein n=1 Tax=Diaporthe vaccinii TaxID=105482 RepID=A0ABR4FFS6_9PEZI
MNLPSKTDEAVFRDPTSNQVLASMGGDMITCQSLKRALGSKEAGGRGIKTYDRLFQGYNGAMLTGHIAMSLISDPKVPDTDGRGGPIRHITSFWDGSSSTPSGIWNWISWLLSVLVCSVALSCTRDFFQGDLQKSAAREIPNQESTSTIQRRSTCPVNNGVDETVYNTPLHVGALFIILFVSTTACAFPILAVSFPGLRIPAPFFFPIRHFGTGVLIATAFVHLFPTAFTLLGNSCLPDFWTEKYTAMPGAMALAAIFMLMLVEMLIHPSRRQQPAANHGGVRVDPAASTETTIPPSIMGPLAGRSSSIGRSLSQIDRQDEERQITEEQKQRDEKRQRDIMHCVMLEAGILFHSVFIGMALSVSINNEFVVLLIAIAFHQTFEGLALGSRIADIDWPKKAWKPWLMALAYGCTHVSRYNPNDTFASFRFLNNMLTPRSVQDSFRSSYRSGNPLVLQPGLGGWAFACRFHECNLSGAAHVPVSRRALIRGLSQR